MKRLAHILAVVSAAVAVRAADRAAVSGTMEAVRLAVATNGAAAARSAVSGIDWAKVRDPVSEIRALKKQVEGRAGFESVERELKTKLRLLTPGAKMDGGDGTLAVPVAEAPVVPLPYLRVVRVSPSPDDAEPPGGILLAGTLSLRIPVAWVDGLDMPVVSARSGIADGIGETYGVFVSGRDVWAARYAKLRRFRDENGAIFTPAPGTSLHGMLRDIESCGDRYDAMVDSYNERVERMQWRKRALKGQGVSR